MPIEKMKDHHFFTMKRKLLPARALFIKVSRIKAISDLYYNLLVKLFNHVC